MEEGEPLQRFRYPIHPKALLAIVPALGLLIYNSTLQPDIGVLRVIAMLPVMAVLLLVPTLFVFLIRRRSTDAASLTFCIMSGFLLLSQLGAHMRLSGQLQEGEFRAELNPVLERYGQRIEQAASDAGGTGLDVETTQAEFVSGLRQAASRLDGVMRRAMLGVAKVIEDEQEARRELEDSTAELDAFEPLDYAALTSIKAIQRRTRALDHCAAANRRFIQSTRSLPGRIRETLRSEGVPPGDVDGIVAAAMRHGSFARSIRIRELELGALSAMREILQLLDDHWEQWVWNAESQTLEVESDELLERLLMLTSRVQAAAADQEALHELEFQKQRQLIRSATE